MGLSPLKRTTILLLSGTFIWLIPSLYNGFPIIQDDTHAYLYSGMAISVPFDRPIFYGIFLLITSLHLSLWLPVIIQCFITFWLINRLLEIGLMENYRPYYTILISALLLISPAAINANQLLPDAFTPILILSFILFWIDDIHSKKYFWLILLSGLMHNSHWLILICLLFFVALYYIKTLRKHSLKFKKLGIAFISILLVLSASNYSKFQTFSPSPASKFFLLGRLVESGAMSSYLDTFCEKQNAKLCAHKDSLNLLATDFYWNSTISPLYKIGGYQDNKAELDDLVDGTLSKKESRWLFIQNSYFLSINQLLFNRSILDKLEPEERIHQLIKKWFPLDVYLSQNSHQTKVNQRYSSFNKIFNTLLALSLVLVVISWVKRKSTSILISSLLLVSILLNTVITASFAGLDSRLQARAAWLLLLLGFILIIQFYKKNYSSFSGVNSGAR